MIGMNVTKSLVNIDQGLIKLEDVEKIYWPVALTGHFITREMETWGANYHMRYPHAAVLLRLLVIQKKLWRPRLSNSPQGLYLAVVDWVEDERSIMTHSNPKLDWSQLTFRDEGNKECAFVARTTRLGFKFLGGE